MRSILKFTEKLKLKIVLALGGGRCPKCNSWIDSDDDGCQTCGYPWSD